VKPDQFTTEQQKHLVKTIGGAWAFVPPPLPPNIKTDEIATNLTSSASAIGELNGAARRLQNPDMLIRALLRQEALTSSAMEGTITTIKDIMREELEPTSGKDDNARETFNYISALREANERLKTLPISHRVIKEAHANLLSGLSTKRGAGKRPGEYKVHQNAVGNIGDNIQSARYVPPPPLHALKCIDSLEAFINRERATIAEKLIDIALCHYQFEAIHPFDDGNGRIGRMLVTLMAQQLRVVELPLLHISAQMENIKSEYLERLFAVSTKSDWPEWINFFLEVLEKSSRRAIQVVDRIIALQAEFTKHVLANGKSPRLRIIVDELFTRGWTTVTETQKLCGVTFPTAQSDLRELVDLAILIEDDGKRPAIYWSVEIIALSERGIYV
jgi:Fic family protein